MPGRTRTINNISGDGAGRKRSRREADQDGDEEDIVDVREASSALQSETVCLFWILIQSTPDPVLEKPRGLC